MKHDASLSVLFVLVALSTEVRAQRSVEAAPDSITPAEAPPEAPADDEGISTDDLNAAVEQSCSAGCSFAEFQEVANSWARSHAVDTFDEDSLREVYEAADTDSDGVGGGRESDGLMYRGGGGYGYRGGGGYTGGMRGGGGRGRY